MRAFLRELNSNELLLHYITLSQIYVKENKEAAKSKLIKLYQDETIDTSSVLIDFLQSQKGDILFDIRTYQHYYGQMAFSRAVDNLITYFKDILVEVTTQKPNILKSKDQERLDFILSFETIEELRRSLADKKINELFYKGIDEIEKYFEDRLNIKLFKSATDKTHLSMYIKRRNLIVHNRGRITKEYLREFPDSKFPENFFFTFSYEELSSLNVWLNNFVVYIDNEIAEKFELQKGNPD